MAQTPAGGYHVPVMTAEVVELLAPLGSGVVVDATFGGGGHTAALLAAAPGLRILAVDRDPDAIALVPVDTRVRAVTANFADLALVLEDRETRRWIDEPDPGHPGGGLLAGVLFDLGVSSHQLDAARRGFSYHVAGPLDMRMGVDAARTAGDIVNGADRDELVRIFRRYGEERFAPRIADAVVRHRPFDDTAQLAAVVAAAIPAAGRRAGHPARRVFQAIRIAVNDELDAIAAGLDAAVAGLRPGGRIVVIAYHSLEDRIVKRRLVRGSKGCVCPPEFPVCVCDTTQELRLLTRKPPRPSLEEIARNPRARSALLRAAERIVA
ncbi:16S rRNA (cytosine(1402)-N(4))-methyltransferase RsmH [soil metagenome]